MDQPVHPRFPWLATVAVGWLLVVDSIRAIPAGPVTLSGAATLVVAGLCVVQSTQLLLQRPAESSYRRPLGLLREPLLPRTAATKQPLAATLALIYMFVSLAAVPTVEGVQNVAVYAMFFLGVALVADNVSAGSARHVSTVMLRLGIVATVVAVATFSAGVYLYAPRAYALAAIPIVALAIPERQGGWLIRWSPYLVIVAVAFSLSRTALFVIVTLMVFRVVRRPPGGRSWKAIAAIVLAAAALYYATTSIPAIRDRFTEGDNATVGGVSINTSGRTALWSATWESAQKHLWFGNGPGSAADLIMRVYPPNAHPHNDWLRLLHDFGLVGAGLFLLGYVVLVVRVLRNARRTDDTIHWSALIALAGVAGTAITDNVLTYPFVMLPVAVLVGLSLAAPVSTGRDDPADATRSGTPPARSGRTAPARSTSQLAR